MSDTKDKDLQLWETWRRTRSEADLQALMDAFAGLLRREIQRWSSIAPAFYLENEAKRLAKKAFESYNPSFGVALGTHVVNQLQPLSRPAYARQSSVSVPEHHRLTFNKYQRVRSQLEDRLGRNPTHDEISDHLAIPPKKLQSIIDNVGKRELLESGEGPAFQKKTDDDLIHLAYNDMTPRQRKIFELRTGYNGSSEPDESKIKDGAEIIKELGITQGVLSYELQKIQAVLRSMQELR